MVQARCGQMSPFGSPYPIYIFIYMHNYFIVFIYLCVYIHSSHYLIISLFYYYSFLYIYIYNISSVYHYLSMVDRWTDMDSVGLGASD